MDFFSLADIAEEVCRVFFVFDNIALFLAIAGVGYAVLYVFQTVGLFTIACREGYSHKWMAFIPFFNTYYIGVCSQKNKFMRISTKKVALVTALVEVIIAALYIVFYAAWSLVKRNDGLLPNYYNGQYMGMEYSIPMSSYLNPQFSVIHPELIWAGWCYRYMRSWVINMFEIAFIFLHVALLTCFFQTYSSRHYFIFSLLGALFPISAIFIFAVRNNKGMSYAEYIRTMQEQFYRQYRSQQNNPYGGYNNPGGNVPPQDAGRTTPKDPFSEYGGDSAPKDPFDEFKN